LTSAVAVRTVIRAGENEMAAGQAQPRGQLQQRGESGSPQEAHAAHVDDDHGRAVEGIGETRARSIKEGLNRLAESCLLERYA
jgi:hypothetical protein